MKTIEDVVLEQAAEDKMGTDEGLRYLELEDHPKNFVTANMYCAALAIIRKLQKEIENLHDERYP